MIKRNVPPLSPPLDEARMSCQLCGPFFHQVEIRFDAGSVEATANETLTGANSNATGVVSEVVLEGGSYANNDAYGTIVLTGATGVDSDGLWGEDDELLNGSTGGNNMMTLNDNGFQKSYWHLWPINQLVKRDGKYYCVEHYHFRFDKEDLEKARIHIKERESIP